MGQSTWDKKTRLMRSVILFFVGVFLIEGLLNTVAEDAPAADVHLFEHPTHGILHKGEDPVFKIPTGPVKGQTESNHVRQQEMPTPSRHSIATAVSDILSPDDALGDTIQAGWGRRRSRSPFKAIRGAAARAAKAPRAAKAAKAARARALKSKHDQMRRAAVAKAGGYDQMRRAIAAKAARARLDRM